MSEIGRRVSSALKAAGLRQSDLAEHLGLTTSQVSKSLNGKRQFTSWELAMCADLFNVSLYWLTTGRRPAPLEGIAARHAYDHENAQYVNQLTAHDERTLAQIAHAYTYAYMEEA